MTLAPHTTLLTFSTHPQGPWPGVIYTHSAMVACGLSLPCTAVVTLTLTVAVAMNREEAA
jgi:hypothetical protein